MGRNPYQQRGSMKTHSHEINGRMHRWGKGRLSLKSVQLCMPQVRQWLKNFGKAFWPIVVQTGVKGTTEISQHFSFQLLSRLFLISVFIQS